MFISSYKRHQEKSSCCYYTLMNLAIIGLCYQLYGEKSIEEETENGCGNESENEIEMEDGREE
ncbi:unnamed protein product [Prunus armeniaca]